jgi:hypothetical protein
MYPHLPLPARMSAKGALAWVLEGACQLRSTDDWAWTLATEPATAAREARSGDGLDQGAMVSRSCLKATRQRRARPRARTMLVVHEGLHDGDEEGGIHSYTPKGSGGQDFQF